MHNEDEKTLKQRLNEQKRAQDQQEARDAADIAHQKRQAKVDFYWKGKGRVKGDEKKHGLSIEQLNQSLSEVDANSYAEWTSVMMKLLNAAITLNNVMNETYSATDIAEGLINYMNSTPTSTAQTVAQGIWDKSLGRVFGAVKKLGPGPQVVFSANIDENGKLDVKATADGQPFSKDAQELFERGVVVWATEQHNHHNNIQFDPHTKVFTENGQVMTADRFEKISGDETHGLRASFEANPELGIDMKPSNPQP